MPRQLTKFNVGVLIAFILLIFGIIASFATATKVIAQTAEIKDSRSVSVVEIDEPINANVVNFIRERLRIAKNEKSYGVAIVFNTTEIDFDASLEFAKILLQYPQVQKIAYVRQRVESALMIPILAFDEINLEFSNKNNATLGPYNQKKYSDFVVSEAISYFRGTSNKQKSEFAALIEKYFDNSTTLYAKVDPTLTSFKLEKADEFTLLSGQGKHLIISPTEARKIGIASLVQDESFEEYLKSKNLNIGKRYSYKPTGSIVKNESSETKIVYDTKDFENNRAVIIDISTDMGEIVADSIERRIEEARKLNATMIILKLNTPGGRIDSTLRMIKSFEKAAKDMVLVAWVDSEAISAGAMLAVTCKYIAMSEQSKIGDCQPIIPTSEGYTVAGEKIQTYLRNHFRLYAEQHEIPAALGEAMVTEGLKVVEIKPKSILYGEIDYPRFMIEEDFENWNDRDRFEIVRTVVREGELLTLTDTEAREYGFALADVKTFEDLQNYFDIKSVVDLEVSNSELFLRFMNSIAPIIIGLGMLGLLIEMKTPGFGLFGILGIAIIGGFFGIKMMVGLADYWEMLIFALGVILIIMEIFIIPGTGIFGILGVLAIVAGIFLAGQPFLVPSTGVETEMLNKNISSMIFSVIGALITFYFVAKYMHKIPILRNLILDMGDATEQLHASAVEIKQDELVGAIGHTTTDLRPVGKAIIGSELYDVQVKGHDFVEKDSKIIVIETSGNRIIVRRYEIRGEAETKI